MDWRTIIAGMMLAVAAAATPANAAGDNPPKAAQPAPWLPASFTPPVLAKASGFKLVPLGPALVKIDYDAYMASIEHLQKTFTRSTDWPHKNLTAADAMADMESEATRFRKRESFAYGVLTPDGRRERGSVYVSPSNVAGYDAVVRLWVTKAEYDAGFDAELHAWVQNWVRAKWPFAKVAYPGRAIDWATWDALVATSKKNGKA
ncbi:twin-arginine translocation pathway signal protein [Sandarakinorhabdus sp.]|uniref:twin-arginine translocation pathway signal protein n=1 Tax=Sandarakinorhabdus sp. TaxID=1916663 RepID=UPI00286EADC0|nr:twin-arginine translocation pathway signal protein [Sandarakinorhabdus sp.]